MNGKLDVDADEGIEALLRSPHGLLQMMLTLPDRLIAVDREHRIRFLLSPDAGSDPLESPAHGRSVYEFVPPDVHEVLRARLDDVFESGVVGSYETLARTLGGESRWFSAKIAPLADEAGNTLLAIILTHDVTELYEHRVALEQALERMRELDVLKSQFVANVVHDLRTPITVIQGFAETLQRRWDEFGDEDRRRFLDHMSTGTHRLMRLVDDVLLAFRLESGDLPLRQEGFDLAELASSVAGELEHGAPSSIVVEAPATAPAYADELRIRQVLVNLIANAQRYAPAGEPVVLRVSRPDSDAPEWLVEVIDRGHGIAVEDQELLFARFSQITDESGGHGGSGLGLYICRSIIDAHGGQIGVESARGEGARFWFTIAYQDA